MRKLGRLVLDAVIARGPNASYKDVREYISERLWCSGLFWGAIYAEMWRLEHLEVLRSQWSEGTYPRQRLYSVRTSGATGMCAARRWHGEESDRWQTVTVLRDRTEEDAYGREEVLQMLRMVRQAERRMQWHCPEPTETEIQANHVAGLYIPVREDRA